MGRPTSPAGRPCQAIITPDLGVQAMIGRTITDEDDKASASPVAVLSYRYWQRRFSGDPGVIGKQINLNNVAFTVIGVASGF